MRRNKSPFTRSFAPPLARNEPSEPPEGAPQPEVGYQIRRVQYGGFETVLLGECRDTESGKSLPLWVDMLGPKNAVRALIARAMDKKTQAAESSDDPAAFEIDALGKPGEVNSFRCPSDEYKSIVQPVEMSPDLAFLPSSRKPTLHQGRILSHLTTSLAGNDECYVPVYRQIHIPQVADAHGRTAEDLWQLYLQSVAAPHSPEFAKYKAPLWCRDLYNVYMFLSARVRVPMHQDWMPYLFDEARTVYFTGANENQDESAVESMVSGRLLSFVKAYVSPLVLEAEVRLGLPIMEHGAYHLFCHPAKDKWQDIIYRNPDRFKGIAFAQIEHHQIITDTKNAEDLEPEIFGTDSDDSGIFA